jgi:hypothetical protein
VYERTILNVRWVFYVKYVNSTEDHEHFMFCNIWISHHLSALSTYFWNLERHIFLTFYEKINMRLWATCLNHWSVFTVAEMAAPRDARVYLWRCGGSSWVIESLTLLFLLHDMFWLVSERIIFWLWTRVIELLLKFQKLCLRVKIIIFLATQKWQTRGPEYVYLQISKFYQILSSFCWYPTIQRISHWIFSSYS